jgi:D-alanyl-D-alanine carboxypeptidase-like protein
MRLLLLAMLALQAPPFTHTVSRVTPDQLPYSWHHGCPVVPAQLRRLRLAYWGFDGRAHTGTLVVNADAVGDLVRVFSRLYAARFPIRKMRPIDAYRGRDEVSLEADNTAAFNCRYVIALGPRRWSAHAFGRAIDVNPIENPYLEGGRVHPRAGWRCEAGYSCAHSQPSAGHGAGVGQVPPTTSTFPRPAADTATHAGR